MAAKTSRRKPRKATEDMRSCYRPFRCTEKESESFSLAAKIGGVDFAEWARSALREVARRQLQDKGKPVSFDEV